MSLKNLFVEFLNLSDNLREGYTMSLSEKK